MTHKEKIQIMYHMEGDVKLLQEFMRTEFGDSVRSEISDFSWRD